MKKIKPLGCSIHGGEIWFSPLINRVIRISVPILLTCLLVSLLFWLYDDTTALQLGGLLLIYFIPPAGKESVIPAAIALGFPWEIICMCIVWVDMASSLFLIWNFDVICRVPYLGDVIRLMIRKGEGYLEKHKWLERLYFIGLISLVFFPLQGTGSTTGSIVGRILGLKSIEILAAIFIGSFLSSFIIGYSVYALNHYLEVSVWYILALVIALLVIIPVGSYIYYRWTQNRAQKSP